ncbi:urate hydroxylase PuuD [Psychrobacter sp.]|uniref:urate hydroxylase PuuD n=1 Tax=Psychrobacter sp. TaxID=56811 RepID=UPI0025F17CC3|nr:urate hydroxylase PuuD [Psychrobacter sp.]
MGAYLLEWLQLFFRWFHVIAGVAWIGASFYFVWLDLSLQKPPEWKKKKGISGDLWAVHGGGFYEVAKYKLEPEEMPEKLHWFKWEAYTTWLTGMAMLFVVYYFNASAYLIDPTKVAFSSNITAVALSLLFIFGNYFIYEAIVRSELGKNALIFSVLIFILMVTDSWLAYQIFSDRAAYIHVGAILGTIMVGNVFFGIMPAQRALVECVRNKQKPGPKVAELALQAKNRSLMNNYFTLPLVFIMISNHYPMTYAHESGWLVLVYISIITAIVRHYFNQKHLGNKKPRYLLIPALMALVLIFWMRPQPNETSSNTSITASNNVIHETTSSSLATDKDTHDDSKTVVANTVNFDAKASTQIMQVVNQRCATCHSMTPSQPGFHTAPQGIVFKNAEDLRTHKAKILTALQTKYMPLGNITNMTDAERSQLIAYLSLL